MTTPIVLPELGAGDQPLRVCCWLVDPGEAVEEGDRLVEVLAPGVTFDVTAPASGVVARIDKAENTPLRAGDILGWIES